MASLITSEEECSPSNVFWKPSTTEWNWFTNFVVCNTLTFFLAPLPNSVAI